MDPQLIGDDGTWQTFQREDGSTFKVPVVESTIDSPREFPESRDTIENQATGPAIDSIDSPRGFPESRDTIDDAPATAFPSDRLSGGFIDEQRSFPESRDTIDTPEELGSAASRHFARQGITPDGVDGQSQQLSPAALRHFARQGIESGRAPEEQELSSAAMRHFARQGITPDPGPVEQVASDGSRLNLQDPGQQAAIQSHLDSLGGEPIMPPELQETLPEEFNRLGREQLAGIQGQIQANRELNARAEAAADERKVQEEITAQKQADTLKQLESERLADVDNLRSQMAKFEAEMDQALSSVKDIEVGKFFHDMDSPSKAIFSVMAILGGILSPGDGTATINNIIDRDVRAQMANQKKNLQVAFAQEKKFNRFMSFAQFEEGEFERRKLLSLEKINAEAGKRLANVKSEEQKVRASQYMQNSEANLILQKNKVMQQRQGAISSGFAAQAKQRELQAKRQFEAQKVEFKEGKAGERAQLAAETGVRKSRISAGASIRSAKIGAKSRIEVAKLNQEFQVELEDKKFQRARGVLEIGKGEQSRLGFIVPEGTKGRVFWKSKDHEKAARQSIIQRGAAIRALKSLRTFKFDRISVAERSKINQKAGSVLVPLLTGAGGGKLSDTDAAIIKSSFGIADGVGFEEGFRRFLSVTGEDDIHAVLDAAMDDLASNGNNDLVGNVVNENNRPVELGFNPGAAANFIPSKKGSDQDKSVLGISEAAKESKALRRRIEARSLPSDKLSKAASDAVTRLAEFQNRNPHSPGELPSKERDELLEVYALLRDIPREERFKAVSRLGVSGRFDTGTKNKPILGINPEEDPLEAASRIVTDATGLSIREIDAVIADLGTDTKDKKKLKALRDARKARKGK